jgi:hypothetical protein
VLRSYKATQVQINEEGNYEGRTDICICFFFFFAAVGLLDSVLGQNLRFFLSKFLSI